MRGVSIIADYFKTVTLTGGTVRVEGWSYDTYQANIGALIGIASKTLAETTESATWEEILTPLLAQSKPLIVTSLENGEDDLAKARGILDIMTLTEAVIELNGINEVLMGKLMALMNKLTATLSPPATSPKPSSTKRGKTGTA